MGRRVVPAERALERACGRARAGARYPAPPAGSTTGSFFKKRARGDRRTDGMLQVHWFMQRGGGEQLQARASAPLGSCR